MEVVEGVREIVSLEIGQIAAGRMHTLAIPLRNRSKNDVRIKDVTVSCGCMAAITDAMKVPANETALLYLRIRPEEIGKLAKRATVHFAKGPSLVIRVDALVKSKFSITPNGIGLMPDSEDGVEIKVESNFGPIPFTVESPDPMLAIRQVRLTKTSGAFVCTMKSVDGKMPPRKSEVPILVKTDEKTHQYRLRVINRRSVQVNPDILVARRRDGRWMTRVFVSASGVRESPLHCVAADPKKNISVKVEQRRDVGRTGEFLHLLIDGDTSGHESVDIHWLRKGDEDVLAQSTIILSP